MMTTYLQTRSDTFFSLFWQAAVCFAMALLFFSSCASAAGHQKFVKPPVTAKAQSKGSQKRKKDAGMRTDGRKVAQVKAHPLKTHPLKTMRAAPLSLASASKSMQPKDRLQTVRQGVVSKLMKQLGKPYRYGGESPITGFDCSGLVNYAYRDKLKSTLPRTANSMYHMPSQKAKRVGKTELNAGDLVFFHTHGRGTEHADHVGVYLGGGEFIQAPRTGKDIQISRLGDDYWQERYIGARRVLLNDAVR